MQKADEIVPITLNTEPQDSVASLLALGKKQDEYRAAKSLLAAKGSQSGGEISAPVATSIIPYATADQ